MRTMKKVIALSLVLAMALSMMATAAFKDQEAINEDLTGDISLMVALNVFSEQGTGAGYFEPNRELTREEVAKLVYVLKNKGNDNGATSWTGMNIFKDIESGRWSEGYINYAASVGMMAGTGDGYFNPTAKMSAVEVAKLLLVLNGYKADVQGYLGANWDINIIRDAEAAGIFSNYELPVRGSVTREWVARLMNNGIYATKVKYEDGQAVEQYDLITKEPITFATQDLQMVTTTGILMATPNAKIASKLDDVANNTNGKNKICTVMTGLNSDDEPVTIDFEYDAPLSLLGQYVTVLSKGALNTSNKVYGVTTYKDNVVTTTTMDAVKYDDDDFEGTDASGFAMFVDYVMDADFNPKTGFGADSNDGRTVTLVDYDDNGKYDAGFVKSVVYDKVTYTNPARHTIRFQDNTDLSVSTESAYKKIIFEDSVAKDDIVKITYDFAGGVKNISVQKVDKVTGAVTKLTDKGVATIDGSEYELGHFHMKGYTAIEVSSKALDYYVDGKYVVYSNAISTEAAEQTNIAYVINYGTVESDWVGVKATNKVEIIKNDGTREVLSYVADENIPEDEENAINWAGVADTKGGLVEYVMKSGKVYFRALNTELTANDVADKKEFDKSENKFYANDKTYLVNDETYFFVVDGDDYAVLKASEIKGDMAAKDGTKFAATSDGLPYLHYAVLTGSASAEESKGTAITAANYTTELNDENEKIYKLVVTELDGTEVTLVSDDESMFKGKTNKIVEYTVNDEGLVATLAAKVPTDYQRAALTVHEGNSVMVIDENNNNVVTGTATYKDLADDVKIYYVDAYKSNGEERIIVSEGDGVSVSAQTTEADEYEVSVMYKTDDGEISHIIVEVDGQAIWNSVTK